MDTPTTDLLAQAQRDFEAKHYPDAAEKYRAAAAADSNNALAWQGLARSLLFRPYLSPVTLFLFVLVLFGLILSVGVLIARRH